jgi:nucleoside-diphosphate-sugar epimerase
MTTSISSAEAGMAASRWLVTGGSGFIGTNLVAELLRRNVAVLNLDNKTPLDATHEPVWRRAELLDVVAIQTAFADWQPTHVVHLAARAECDENTTVETGYRANAQGTTTILEAIQQTPSVERAIITSSQYVCGPDHFPKDMEDYGPHTVYGQSKVITEQLTRAAHLPCTWTLIRPTNIWGPWHLRYRQEAWAVIRKGLYLHPAGKPVVRCYGYVGNIVHYILKIMEAPVSLVQAQTFYLGDPPMDIYEWANTFSLGLTGRPARRVPRPILRAIGGVGNLLGWCGIKFPLTTSRYRSMTSDYLCPMDATYAVLGPPPISLQQGVDETLTWLKRYGWT